MEHDPQQQGKLKTILRIPRLDWIYLLMILVVSAVAFPVMGLVTWMISEHVDYNAVFPSTSVNANHVIRFLLTGLCAWLALFTWRLKNLKTWPGLTLMLALLIAMMVNLLPSIDYTGVVFNPKNALDASRFRLVEAWLTPRVTVIAWLGRVDLFGVNIEFILNWMTVLLLFFAIICVLCLPRVKSALLRMLLLFLAQAMFLIMIGITLYFQVIEPYMGWFPQEGVDWHPLVDFGWTPAVNLDVSLRAYLTHYSHLLLFACLMLGMLFIRYVRKDWPILISNQETSKDRIEELTEGEEL